MLSLEGLWKKVSQAACSSSRCLPRITVAVVVVGGGGDGPFWLKGGHVLDPPGLREYQDRERRESPKLCI